MSTDTSTRQTLGFQAEVTQLLLLMVHSLYGNKERHGAGGRYMRQERAGHTLQPTALVHEAYLRLIDGNRIQWRAGAERWLRNVEPFGRFGDAQGLRHRDECLDPPEIHGAGIVCQIGMPALRKMYWTAEPL